MFVVSILINIGMWFERFVIIVSSLNRDFLPSSWGLFRPTIIDVGTFTGTIGVFFTLFLLFMRWLPMVSMTEVKGTMPEADPHYHKKDAPRARRRARRGGPRSGRSGVMEPQPKRHEIQRAPSVILAEFDSAHDVLHAAEKVRDAGYQKWDTHTPFPVHGMDKAMGLGDSRLGWIVICCAHHRACPAPS